MKTIFFNSIDSTNNYCKQNDNGEDFIVVAKTQTKGRGTKGRSFNSSEGGIYLSVMRHYKNFPAQSAFKILVNACVAVCKTLENFGVKPQIRWANDVMVNGKKICGTLIENTFSNGYICRSIVGIGLNVNNIFPPELEDIAISLKDVLNKKINYSKVLQVLLQNIENEYLIEEYKKYMPWLGKEIKVKTANEEFFAVAKDVASDGRLICLIDGRETILSSGEVSVRF